MMQFVSSEAHTAAINAVFEVSRGGSITMLWSTSDEASFGWTQAAAMFESHEGPTY